ncbi:cystathionine beta-lyase [Agromyces albus]|nr:cystathionine beta-lyase [Agromyces albus]
MHLVPDVLAGLRITIKHFTPPGAAVIVPTPAYMPFLDVPARAGREIIQVPSHVVDGRWAMDLDGIDRAFAAGAGLLVLCNPHNPLGQVMTSVEQSALSQVVERHGGRVFSDEIHAPIIYPGATHLPYAALSDATARHTITAIATSKGWNIPGLKTAQLILTNDEDQATWHDRDLVPSQTGSILGAVAAAAAYLDGVDWLDSAVARFDANRHLLAGLLSRHTPEIGMRMPDATYLAWLDFTSAGLKVAPASFLLDAAGIAASDGAACGTGGDGFVRFNFALEAGMLEHAVVRMAHALQEPPSARAPTAHQHLPTRSRSH